MRETSTHQIHQIEINHQDGTHQTLSLEDLKNPATFDAVKHGLDQQRFFSLIDLYPDDAILQCRKAELLIVIENDDEAFALLKANPLLLARGLEAKIYISLNQIEEFISLISNYIWLSEMDLESKDDHELEGLVHIFEMTAVHTARQNLSSFSALFFERALSLAKHLQMHGRASLIEHHLSLVSEQISQLSSPADYQGHNTLTQHFTALVQLRTSWLKGNPRLSPHLPKEYSSIVLAWKSLQAKNPYAVSSMLNDAKSEDAEVNLFKALLNIESILEIGLESKYAFNSYVDSAKLAFKELLETKNMIAISQVYRLFPLSFLIVAQRMQAMQGFCQEIPILTNEKYRDGLRIKSRTIVLPNEFRRAWLEDDLYPSRISQLSLLDKSTRHRAHKKLKAQGIEYFNIVSIVKYLKATQTLIKLGYHDYKELEENLLTSFPKVKNYLT